MDNGAEFCAFQNAVAHRALEGSSLDGKSSRQCVCLYTAGGNFVVDNLDYTVDKTCNHPIPPNIQAETGLKLNPDEDKEYDECKSGLCLVTARGECQNTEKCAAYCKAMGGSEYSFEYDADSLNCYCPETPCKNSKTASDGAKWDCMHTHCKSENLSHGETEDRVRYRQDGDECIEENQERQCLDGAVSEWSGQARMETCFAVVERNNPSDTVHEFRFQRSDLTTELGPVDVTHTPRNSIIRQTGCEEFVVRSHQKDTETCCAYCNKISSEQCAFDIPSTGSAHSRNLGSESRKSTSGKQQEENALNCNCWILTDKDLVPIEEVDKELLCVREVITTEPDIGFEFDNVTIPVVPWHPEDENNKTEHVCLDGRCLIEAHGSCQEKEGCDRFCFKRGVTHYAFREPSSTCYCLAAECQAPYYEELSETTWMCAHDAKDCGLGHPGDKSVSMVQTNTSLRENPNQPFRRSLYDLFSNNRIVAAFKPLSRERLDY